MEEGKGGCDGKCEGGETKQHQVEETTNPPQLRDCVAPCCPLGSRLKARVLFSSAQSGFCNLGQWSKGGLAQTACL